MKIIPRSFNGKNYWKKKGYQLLDGATDTSEKGRNIVRISTTGQGSKKRFVWRVKSAPKVIFRAATSPTKLWNKFRVTYVNMMLRLAGRIGNIHGGPLPHFEQTNKIIERSRSIKKGKRVLDEFETRLVLEIYKSFGTSRGLSEAVV